MEYTQEFKEAIIQKILLNPDRTVVSFAREASIPESTVATWIRNTKKTGKTLNSKKSKKQ
ncbi:transposase [Desulfobacula sp.]